MVRKIIKFPAPSLRLVCTPVDFERDDRQRLLDHVQDLHDTLSETSNGVALASNQIEQLGRRVFVVRKIGDITLPHVVVNPIWTSVGEKRAEVGEGCLSIPELAAFSVSRFTTIQMTWQDIDGRRHAAEFNGFEAQIVQHECEHLDGRLLSDRFDRRRYTILRAEAIKNRKAGK